MHCVQLRFQKNLQLSEKKKTELKGNVLMYDSTYPY